MTNGWLTTDLTTAFALVMRLPRKVKY